MDDLFGLGGLGSAANSYSSDANGNQFQDLPLEQHVRVPVVDNSWATGPVPDQIQRRLLTDETFEDLFRPTSTGPCPFSEQTMGRDSADYSSIGSSKSDSTMGSRSPLALSAMLSMGGDFHTGDLADYATAMMPQAQLPSFSSSPVDMQSSTGAYSFAAAPTSMATTDSAVGIAAAVAAAVAEAPPTTLAAAAPCRSPKSKLSRAHKSKHSGLASCKVVGSDGNEYKLSNEYRDKRARNNEAVRKSRIKSKQKSIEMEEEVQGLRQENADLKRSLESLQSHLQTLQTLRPSLMSEVEQDMQ